MNFIIYLALLVAATASEPLDLASRRELFVDHYLIDQLEGAELRLQVPRDQGTAFAFDRQHEGAFCGYVSIITLPSGGFRAYYRGLPIAMADGSSGEVTAYAESSDGIRWTKPQDNIVLRDAAPATHNLSVMLDPRVTVSAAERWKAIGGTLKTGLMRYVSADGITWQKMMEGQPLLPPAKEYRYDSQNVLLWSEAEGKFLCYFRNFKAVPGYGQVRWVSRASSQDFRNWTEDGEMVFRAANGQPAPIEHLYTNQTSPYQRAPHISVALAARFMPGRQVMSAAEARAINVDPEYFGDISDCVLITTRGGLVYDRTFVEGFLRPGLGMENWTSRTNYPALNVIQTGAAEMSFFVQRGYGQPSHHLARYTLRLDGFSALHADYPRAEMITKYFRFTGAALEINYATSAAGSLRFEIQDELGHPLPGFSLDDAREIIGDQISRVVAWRTGNDVSALAGKIVRLRVVMKDADIFSLRFR